MANPVDLSSYTNVVVEFETQYRRYNYEQPYIVVGIGDGAGNVTWPDLDPDTDISARIMFSNLLMFQIVLLLQIQNLFKLTSALHLLD